MAKDNAYDAVNSPSPFGQMNNDTQKINEGGVKPKKQTVKKTSAPKRPINHKNVNRKPAKPRKRKYDVDKIKGYSTVRIERKDVVMLKAIQQATQFKSRSALIRDMLKRCKIMYLNTPKKKAAYHDFLKLIMRVLKLKGKLK